jgi:hypothetical protein
MFIEACSTIDRRSIFGRHLLSLFKVCRMFIRACSTIDRRSIVGLHLLSFANTHSSIVGSYSSIVGSFSLFKVCRMFIEACSTIDRRSIFGRHLLSLFKVCRMLIRARSTIDRRSIVGLHLLSFANTHSSIVGSFSAIKVCRIFVEACRIVGRHLLSGQRRWIHENKAIRGYDSLERNNRIGCSEELSGTNRIIDHLRKPERVFKRRPYIATHLETLLHVIFIWLSLSYSLSVSSSSLLSSPLSLGAEVPQILAPPPPFLWPYFSAATTVSLVFRFS